MEGLQESMNRLQKYCNEWGLTFNINKYKYMLSNCMLLINPALYFNGKIIERVESAKYLGIEFSYDGNIKIAK